jgi:DnaD/phage-associated family protein
VPERGFNTEFWTRPFVQNLPAKGKLLLAYLKTNAHCNQAGVYTITPHTIAFETGLPLTEIPALLKSLEPEVVWYPEENIVWVKSFFEEQAKSSKFIASALSIITRNRLPEDLPDDFQEYNSRILARITLGYPIGLTKRECVAIRDKFTCQYCQKVIKQPADYEMDHIVPKVNGGKSNYLNLVTSCRACNQKKLDKTPEEVGLITPRPRAFHAAQAVFLLKNSPELKKGWLQLFPERAHMADSILSNIEQHYSISMQDTPLSNAATATKSSSGSDNGGGEGTAAPEKISAEVEDKEMAVISELYEANIGMLTPVVAERLRDVRARYPPGWFGEALREAVASEHRNLKYIEAILARWKTEGFKSRIKGRKERYGRSGEYRQDIGTYEPHEWEETPEPDDTS